MGPRRAGALRQGDRSDLNRWRITSRGPGELVAAESDHAAGTRIDISITNPTNEAINLGDVEVHVDMRPERVLEHGWQSWSVVRSCSRADVRPERVETAEWGRAVHVAQPERAGRVVAGDQFLLTDSGLVGALDARRNLTTVEARADGVVAVALLDAVELGPREERTLDPLWLASGDPGELYSEYAELWGSTANARGTGQRSWLGWCSWYHVFAGVTPDHVRKNLKVAAAHGFEVVQVDDGWQRAIGDWLEVSDRWRVPMRDIAGEIRRVGLIAGIWTAPFLAAASSELASTHPDWIVTHRSGHPLRAMHNTAWGGWALALDTTNPAVLEHLRTTYAALRQQGFAYHKIDFCYAAAMQGRRHNRAMTRAEALRAGLDAVRDGIGDDAFLLGCGCPFGPAVGVVDAMRVSPDVAPHWETRGHWPGFEESAVAAINAIRTSVLRAPLHRRLWLNDPDCLLLRADALDARRRAQLSESIVSSGGFTVVSDDLSEYGPSEWAALDDHLTRARANDRTCSLVDPFATSPVVVRE